MSGLILYGAGACGGYVIKHLRSKGIEPAAIVDSSQSKWGTDLMGMQILSPEDALILHPDAEWVATAISRPSATEIRAAIKALGVKTKPLWECLDVCHGLPPEEAYCTLRYLINDDDLSVETLADQISFRAHPNYDHQPPPEDCADIYFPDFIQHRDDEHFVDCGAADGDTVRAFIAHWSSYAQITAFEPDEENYSKLNRGYNPRLSARACAVGDRNAKVSFTSNGDYSSHLGGSGEVFVVKLDDFEIDPPTYIKFDIEGAELEALWGARRILKEHSPVLAICAYHTSDHLWQIPLLIHAIQPDYKLFFRRYAEGAFEIVWYAVPPDRVISPILVPAAHESYSDNHSG